MWILIVISLITGERIIEESPFRNQSSCEERMKQFKGMDATKYKIVCIHKTLFNEGERDHGIGSKSGVRDSASEHRS